MNRAGIDIATLQPGERVVIHLAARKLTTVNEWAGAVRAVDGVGIRLAVAWRTVGLSPAPADGECVIPWRRIAHIEVQREEDDGPPHAARRMRHLWPPGALAAADLPALLAERSPLAGPAESTDGSDAMTITVERSCCGLIQTVARHAIRDGTWLRLPCPNCGPRDPPDAAPAPDIDTLSQKHTRENDHAQADTNDGDHHGSAGRRGAIPRRGPDADD